MNRRRFLTALFGMAALPLLERLDIPTYPPLDVVENPGDELFFATYEATLQEFRRLFDASYKSYLGVDYLFQEVSDQENKLGMRVCAAPLRHQFNVGFGDNDLAASGATGRYLPAAAGALAIAAAQSDVGLFVNLELPKITWSGRCGPVRMCVDDDPVWYHHSTGSRLLVRFDVLGAETARAVVAHNRVKQRNLKVRIRERLLISRGLQMRLPS